MEEVKLEDYLETCRAELSDLRANLKAIADQRDPKIGPEVTIAMRDVENARMRLGVAIAVSKGLDPWDTKVNEKKGA